MAPLPPDVPQPVSDLVYHMLAKTPEERPASVRVVADRADVLRDALTLGESTHAVGYPGATRADLPAAATGVLLGGEGPGSGRPRGAGSRRTSRRQLVAAGSTAVLCAAAVATGLYLSGHFSGHGSGNVGSNTAQHLSSPTATPSRSASPHPRPTLHPSQVREQPSASPSPTGNPQPTKSVKPTPSHKASPTASASTSASSSPTVTSSPTATAPTSPSTTPSS
ncbi:MAG: hypothetical protein ACRD0H_27415 [Actinomycetes bacterium]